MSKQITIGIDISRGNTTTRTGVEEYVFQLLSAIINNKQVAINSATKFVLYTREPLIPELENNLPDNVIVKVLKWPPKRFWTQVRLSWEMLFYAPDVLFVPGHVVPLIHPKKTVMTVHDVAAVSFPKSFNWFERWYSLWSAKYSMKTLWKVIVPSEFTKQELQKLLNIDKKLSSVHVVPLAYDKKFRVIESKEKIEEILNTYHIQKPFVLSVGRLEAKKNTVRIIHAFELLKKRQMGKWANGQLVLVGGRGHGYEDVEKAIKESPYKNDIILPGHVSDPDLPYLMHAADVFVFPSLYEGFGIPILEAYACGTPVVTSNGTSCKEVAGDVAVLVDPLDVDDIASGIEQAMKKEYVEEGLERVKHFSWEKTMEKTLHLLLEE